MNTHFAAEVCTFFSLGRACIFGGGLHPRFGAERYWFGGGIVELAVAVGNHFVASKRVVLLSKIEGFRYGPCHVEAIAQRSILQMLISRGKFIGFWKEIPIVESVTQPSCRMRRLPPRAAAGGSGRRHAARGGGAKSWGDRRRQAAAAYFPAQNLARILPQRCAFFFRSGRLAFLGAVCIHASVQSGIGSAAELSN